MPACVDGEHAVADPQFSRHRVDDRDVAAVRIHKNELAAPGARDAVADLGPRPGDGLQRKRKRAGIFDMSLDLPIALMARSTPVLVGDFLDRGREIALVDERIDPDRQVRPMLLDRGNRQDRDDFAHVGGGEIAPAHLRPRSCRSTVNLRRSRRARGDRLDLDLEFRPRKNPERSSRSRPEADCSRLRRAPSCSRPDIGPKRRRRQANEIGERHRCSPRIAAMA